MKNDSARKKYDVRSRPGARTNRKYWPSVEWDARVENRKDRDPPSGLKPAATATASTSVDFPDPFSPTRNVVPGGKSSPPAARSPVTSGRSNGYPSTGAAGSSRIERTKRPASRAGVARLLTPNHVCAVDQPRHLPSKPSSHHPGHASIRSVAWPSRAAQSSRPRLVAVGVAAAIAPATDKTGGHGRTRSVAQPARIGRDQRPARRWRRPGWS